MGASKTDIWVYADWVGLDEPRCIGILSAHQGKGKKAFSFEYDKDWLRSEPQMLLDPDINWYSGPQFPIGKENFGIFLDSMPDTWGRTLMKRREFFMAEVMDRPPRRLYEIDYLLGVFDEGRMGALRFKRHPDGPFMNSEEQMPTPPWSLARKMQWGIKIIEDDADVPETRKWLKVLMAPGSSLGGARPKSNIEDENGEIWIAKFPSKNDRRNKAAWEYLAYLLALEAGIDMAPSKLERLGGDFDTFFTKRFDRIGKARIHFASAMTMTGNNEDTIRDNPASYLEIAEFIQFSGSQNKKDLRQLWRRIAFSIAISNTDDHMRNHGFIIQDGGWRLSPAYDINPSTEKDGLSLNIDMDHNALDFDLLRSVGEYFQLKEKDMSQILQEVGNAVSQWKAVAKKIGISRREQEAMASAFRIPC